MDAALPPPTSADHRLAAARHAFSTPERVPMTPHEEAALAGAAEPPLRHEGLKLARWTLGTGPRVLLVHGWNSRGAHLLDIAQALVEAGFSATLFDLPAHGDSGGQAASVVHAARALRAMAADCGPVHGVVGHSMGSAAALLAFADGLQVARSAHLAGPSSLTPMIKWQADIPSSTPTAVSA
ncbi:alpha/beta hydrolase [Roseateles sp. BYS96W]|uniref:Alpha/beta hydrolase n=1 Tax=Pelomonas nitida TaxID=3299027 RepID=A0ABW7FZZ5_9BURK